MNKKSTWIDILKENEQKSREKIKNSQIEETTDYYDMCSTTEDSF